MIDDFSPYNSITSLMKIKDAILTLFPIQIMAKSHLQYSTETFLNNGPDLLIKSFGIRVGKLYIR